MIELLLRKMSGVDFISSAIRGDIIEIGMETIKFGKTITIRCDVRNKFLEKLLLV